MAIDIGHLNPQMHIVIFYFVFGSSQVTYVSAIGYSLLAEQTINPF